MTILLGIDCSATEIITLFNFCATVSTSSSGLETRVESSASDKICQYLL